MLDRGMIVTCFEFCRVEEKCSVDCPYWDNNGSASKCTKELAKDVLSLLKEQKPATFKPHYIDKYGKHFICGVECGSCHKEISSTYHYCPFCGKAVKWDI